MLEACLLKTGNEVFRRPDHLWSKIFVVDFGMGVVSGLAMGYEFGTNWIWFPDFAGGITSRLLAYEVLTTFVLEAGFLLSLGTVKNPEVACAPHVLSLGRRAGRV